MKKVAGIYFSHPFIWIYLMGFAGLLILTMQMGVLQKYYSLILIPILLSPFYEWVTHKYILHRKVDPQTSPRGYEYMRKLHYIHHEDPKNTEYIFAPLSAALFIFIEMFVVFSILFWSWEKALVIEIGVVAFYLYYEWVHLAHHVPQYNPLTPLGKKMKQAHLWHHFRNENYWWGITSHYGDLALKTFPHANDVEASPTCMDINKAGS
jgi:hypothetical protein